MMHAGNPQRVMARLDRAIQLARVHAPTESYDRLDGPLLRAMTV